MNKRLNPSKALSGIIDWGVFIIASIVLFLKTSDMMAYYAPSQIGGYTGIKPIYGFVAALIVEGTLVLLKISVKYSENDYAYLWNVGLIILVIGISGLAQVVDGWITTGTLSQQPESTQMAVEWIVPLIPLLILVAIMIKTTLAVLPQEKKVSETSANSGKKLDFRNLTEKEKSALYGKSTADIRASYPQLSERSALNWKNALDIEKVSLSFGKDDDKGNGNHN